MKLTDFIRMQNKEMVERGNISFKLLLPLNMGGKWFFYCDKGKTIDDLCKWVEEQKINVKIEFPWNNIIIEYRGEDGDGHINCMYVFDFNDYKSSDDDLKPNTQECFDACYEEHAMDFCDKCQKCKPELIEKYLIDKNGVVDADVILSTLES